jgi:CheY-like chemotaxis protein
VSKEPPASSAQDVILVVDDNPLNMKLVTFLLRKQSYQVFTAGDANEALRMLGDLHPRLILMDLQMPGIDGLTLTRQLRADPRYADTVIVAVTASAMKGDEQRATRAGCDGYITKPIDTRAFPGLIRSYLQGRSRQP